MKIANPIYDSVFKYLMEDTEIAKELISVIIGEEVVELELRPQEHTGKSEQYLVMIFRLDFKAIIKTKEGTLKKILIELQKGKKAEDITRFRKYLGENYIKKDLIQTEDGVVTKDLPIIAIYFLGFSLKNVPTSALKVNRVYTDLIENVELNGPKEEFIEMLSHDSYIIQIPRLRIEVKNEMERILNVFNQSYVVDGDNRILEINDSDIESDLIQKMANRLRFAILDEKVQNQISIEEEVERTIEKHIRDNSKLMEALEVKEKTLEENEKKIQDHQKEIAAQQKIIEELNRKLKDQKDKE